jgi:hypothetical protein
LKVHIDFPYARHVGGYIKDILEMKLSWDFPNEFDHTEMTSDENVTWGDFSRSVILYQRSGDC